MRRLIPDFWSYDRELYSARSFYIHGIGPYPITCDQCPPTVYSLTWRMKGTCNKNAGGVSRKSEMPRCIYISERLTTSSRSYQKKPFRQQKAQTMYLIEHFRLLSRWNVFRDHRIKSLASYFCVCAPFVLASKCAGVLQGSFQKQRTKYAPLVSCKTKRNESVKKGNVAKQWWWRMCDKL